MNVSVHQSSAARHTSAPRRLAAILAADVAGYALLMGADEEATLEWLEAHRWAVIDPKITEHHGRIVKTTDLDSPRWMVTPEAAAET